MPALPQRTCPICNTIFRPAVPHQEYDKLSCRKMASRHRARLKDKGVQIQTKSHHGAADHATIMQPKVEDLDALAETYRNNPFALQTYCFEPVPEWTPPMEDIMWARQFDHTTPRGFWILCNMQLLSKPLTPVAVAEAPRPQISALSILDRRLPKMPENSLIRENETTEETSTSPASV